MEPTLVVGYDGSPASRAALSYAASHVDGGRLFIVTSAERPPSFLGEPNYQRVLDASQAHAHRLLTDAAAQVPDSVRCETELLDGSPAEAIVGVARTRNADEIVIGSRGLGPIQAMLGSVSHAVLQLADRPVVVIPAAGASDSDA